MGVERPLYTLLCPGRPAKGGEARGEARGEGRGEGRGEERDEGRGEKRGKKQKKKKDEILAVLITGAAIIITPSLASSDNPPINFIIFKNSGRNSLTRSTRRGRISRIFNNTNTNIVLILDQISLKEIESDI